MYALQTIVIIHLYSHQDAVGIAEDKRKSGLAKRQEVM